MATRVRRRPGATRDTRDIPDARDAGVSRELTFAEQTSTIDDRTGPMGIRLLVQREGGRGDVIEAPPGSPMLVLPVHAGIAEIAVGATKHLVDKASWLLAPAGTRARVRARSPVTHTLLLTVTPALRRSVVDAYGHAIELARFDRYVEGTEMMPRTNWVNELGHRYLFERAVCEKRDNAATTFLEMELVKEVYFICHERYTTRERSSVVESSGDVMQRALALIEKHLFEPDVVQRLAARSGASASTLLRTFQREVGQSPLGYVRARRLDESLLLLKSKRYAVGEVGTMVGYASFAAFSQAFRARFKKRPSEI